MEAGWEGGGDSFQKTKDFVSVHQSIPCIGVGLIPVFFFDKK